MLSSSAWAQAPCEPPSWIAPSKDWIADTRPRLEWTPVAGANAYRVWVESRVPEGRVLFTHEFQTTTSFWQPPQPFTDAKANVRVRVEALCQADARVEHTASTPLEARFRIDAGMACVMPPYDVVTTAQSVEISWPELPGTKRFHVSAFPAAASDAAAFSAETPLTRMRLTTLTRGIWTVGVRPRCANGYGGFRFHVLNVN